MKVLAGLVLLCSVVGIYALPRISGGSNAVGYYPYQVSLQYDGFHICGGSILNHKWILTAAHCVMVAPARRLKVLVGTYQLYDGSGELYQAEYSVYHKNFSMNKLTHDVGLIRVDRDIKFSEKVQSVELDFENFSVVDYPARLAGWGRFSLEGGSPTYLQEIKLKTITQKQCYDAWQPRYTITDSHICTLNKVDEGACKGDSGGPLVVGEKTQVGIVSYGQPCAKGYPDVFTRVNTFIEWIAVEIMKYDYTQKPELY